jgi:hypothetical protein
LGYRPHNGFGEILAGRNVTRRYPAPDAAFLEFGANGFGNHFILVGIADKNFVSHYRLSFTHFDFSGNIG